MLAQKGRLHWMRRLGLLSELADSAPHHHRPAHADRSGIRDVQELIGSAGSYSAAPAERTSSTRHRAAARLNFAPGSRFLCKAIPASSARPNRRARHGPAVGEVLDSASLRPTGMTRTRFTPSVAGSCRISPPAT